LLRLARDGSDQLARTQFLTAFQQSGITIDGGEITTLFRAFPGDTPENGRISTFCDAVDPVIEAAAPAAESPESPRRSPRKETPTPSSPVLATVGRIARLAQGSPVSILEEFRHLDRFKHGSVTVADWNAVMTLFKANQRDATAALRQYLIRGTGEVDYVAFCRDADKCQTNEDAAFVDPGDSPILRDVLRRCKALVLSKVTTLDDIFAPFDRFKTGGVPESAVGPAFKKLGLILSDEEVQAIAAACRDGFTSDIVKYRKLGERMQGLVIETERLQGTLNPGYATEENFRELEATKSEIRSKLHARRKTAQSVFAVYDKLKPGEFFDLLEEAGVILLKPQKYAITVGYQNADTGNIDVKRFANDVEKVGFICRPS
jgi:Ca2+-binding EF-hand superfamily protein